MLGSMMVGASSVPPDSITRTCAPEADNSAARTEPAAPAPTTMKSYRLSLFASLIILTPRFVNSVNWLSRPLRKYSGEVLAFRVEDDEPKDRYNDCGRRASVI